MQIKSGVSLSRQHAFETVIPGNIDFTFVRARQFAKFHSRTVILQGQGGNKFTINVGLLQVVYLCLVQNRHDIKTAEDIS